MAGDLYFSSTSDPSKRIKAVPLKLLVGQILDDMEVYYKKRFHTSQRVLGQTHPLTIARLNDLTWVRSHQGYYEEALDLSAETLVLCEAVLGTQSTRYHEYQSEIGVGDLMEFQDSEMEDSQQIELCKLPQTLVGRDEPLEDRPARRPKTLGGHFLGRHSRQNQRRLQISTPLETLRAVKRWIRGKKGYSPL